jgi:purine-binding chemotaxis protein CheW
VSELARAADRDDMLIFKVAGERLAAPAREVAAIIRAPALTRVPNAPENLLGVANLRGVVAPIVSLAGMLGRVTDSCPSSGPASGMRRVVVMDRAATVGLMVDEVCALGPLADASLIDLDRLLARDFGALRRDESRTPDAAHPARPGAARARSAGDEGLAVIGFMLDGQEYALPLETIVEILKPPATVTSAPGVAMAMMGVIAYRNALLPLASARALLGLPPLGFDLAKARVVVIRLGGALVGLTVDSTTALLRIPPDVIDPVPPVLTRGRGEARIEAIGRLDEGRRLVAILSPPTIFDADTAARIAAHGEGARDAAAQPSRGTFEQFVVFRLGDEHYGLPLGAVEEVVRTPERASRMPRAPDFLAGMMNLRGNPLPLIDQRLRFSVPRTGPAEGGGREGARILVVASGGLRAGLVVDAVSEVLTIRSTDLRPAPEFDCERAAIFDRVAVTMRAAEREGRLILIIDPEPLLKEARRDLSSGASADAVAAQ